MNRKVNYIEKHNYKKYLFTEEQKADIAELYNNNNISAVNIAKMYNVGHKTIAKILDELGIKRTGQSKRKYMMNEYYFDCINNQNKSYILGFLWADGHVENTKSTISISLEEHDRNILEKMRHDINSQKELEFIDYSNKHDFGYNYKNQYRLLLYSSHMCKSLNKLGMHHDKSLTATFPSIREDLLSHFVRGLFDGDGSICRYKHKHGFNYTLTITTTESLCKDLIKIANDTLGINSHMYDASNHNGITKVFNISGKIQVKTFMDWLYKDCELKLDRKYNRYINYFYSS